MLFGSGTAREQIERTLRGTGHLRDVDVELRAKNVAVRSFLLSAETVEIQGSPCVLTVMLNITERSNQTDLLTAVQLAMQDTSWLSQRIVERLATLDRTKEPFVASTEVASLPKSVREVLDLVAQGLSDDDIAGQLGISKNTVPSSRCCDL